MSYFSGGDRQKGGIEQKMPLRCPPVRSRRLKQSGGTRGRIAALPRTSQKRARNVRRAQRRLRGGQTVAGSPYPLRHCEERSDEAIQGGACVAGLLRCFVPANDRGAPSLPFRHCEPAG
jgi:hypothetical protein